MSSLVSQINLEKFMICITVKSVPIVDSLRIDN